MFQHDCRKFLIVPKSQNVFLKYRLLSSVEMLDSCFLDQRISSITRKFCSQERTVSRRSCYWFHRCRKRGNVSTNQGSYTSKRLRYSEAYFVLLRGSRWSARVCYRICTGNVSDLYSQVRTTKYSQFPSLIKPSRPALSIIRQNAGA